MRTLIEVKKKHIQKGGCQTNNCPVTLAIKEKCKDVSSVATWPGSIYMHKDGCYIKKKAPRSVQRFVAKYDDKGKKAVKPFNFYLEY